MGLLQGSISGLHQGSILGLNADGLAGLHLGNYSETANPYPLVNLDTFFDVLNFQSNNINNFTISAGAISKWNDLSPEGNHLSQSGAGKPTYNSGAPLFTSASSQFLTLKSELNLQKFSLYIIFKNASPASAGMLISSTSDNSTYVNFLGTRLTTFLINGLQSITAAPFGNENNYNLLSIRRDGPILTIKVNDRLLYTPSIVMGNSPVYKLGQMGRFNSGQNFNGNILSLSVCSRFLSDIEDLNVRNAFYNRYGFLSGNGFNIISVGDSNTVQGQVTLAQTWTELLSTDLGYPNFNIATAGTSLQYSISDVTSGEYKLRRFVSSRPFKDYIVIMYTNGNNGTGNEVSYAASIESEIPRLINAGYPPRQIVLCSGTYRFGDAGASGMAIAVANVLALATKYGTSYADTYNYVKSNGGDALIGDANIHLNAAGHVATKDCIKAAILA